MPQSQSGLAGGEIGGAGIGRGPSAGSQRRTCTRWPYHHPVARAPTVLAGRDVELNRIGGMLASASQGQPGLVIVLGEAGIGKTALAGASMDLAVRSGGLVLAGACLDIGEQGLPYLPVAEALRRLARATAADELDALLGSARGDFAALAPLLSRDPGGELVAPPAPGTDGPSGASQARLFEQFLGLLARLSARGLVFLVIEDVQWVDRATRDLVTFLVRNMTTERVVAMLTCRLDDLPPGHPVLVWLAELGRAPGAVRVELGRLDEASVRWLLNALADAPVDPAMIGRVWRRSGGNPLFVQELLAAERAGITQVDPRPGSLVESLVARVAAMPPTTRRFLDVIAVAGRSMDEETLAVLLGWGASDVADAIHGAIAQGVLVADESAAGYRFRHELLREVVERQLLPGERRLVHERIARLLETRPGVSDGSPAETAAELAYHWTRAGLVPEAYRASVAAATAAEAVQAFSEAHDLLERAFSLEPRLAESARPATGERIALRRRAIDVADLAGESSRATDLARDALAMVDATLDPTTAGILHGKLGYLLWVGGEPLAAIAEHEQAVRLVPATPPSAERARVLAGLGGALMGAGRWAESRTVCEDAITAAAEVGALAEESRARNMLGSDLVALGEVSAGLDQLRRARQIAASGPPSELLVIAHHNLALNLAQADILDEALAVAEEGQVAASRAGLERRFGQDLAAIRADVLLRKGRWALADEATRSGLANAPVGSRNAYLTTVRARLLALRGQTAGALEQLGPLAGSALDPDLAAFAAQVRAEAALADGQASVALQAGARHVVAASYAPCHAPRIAAGRRARTGVAMRSPGESRRCGLPEGRAPAG